MTDPSATSADHGTWPDHEKPARRARCPYCATVEPDIYPHMKRAHEAGSWATLAGGEVIKAPSSQGECVVCGLLVVNVREHLRDEHQHIAALNLTDVEKIGPGRSALYVVGIWPIGLVHRGTVYALLGNTSRSVARSLQRADRDGLLSREGVWIRRINQGAIMARALDGLDDPGHEKLLDLANGSRRIRAEVAAESDAEIKARREDELRFVQSLMRPYSGPMTGARRPVRIVASGRP